MRWAWRIWQVIAVPGLVPDEMFFDHLANRRFPAGNFIRKAHELDYLEEPGIFHYRVEFGLVQQKDGLGIYGSGIASSSTESVFALDDPSPNRIGFDLERVMRTH